MILVINISLTIAQKKLKVIVFYKFRYVHWYVHMICTYQWYVDWYVHWYVHWYVDMLNQYPPLN